MVFTSPLYAIVDAAVAGRAGWDPVELSRVYIEAGVRLLQLRAPEVDAKIVLGWCHQVMSIAAPVDARVILNDRCDLAMLAGTDGVHVGQDDLPVPEARRLLGERAVIGVSTHDDTQVREAMGQPASYLATGPVFDTRTKDTGYPATGLEAVRRTASVAGNRPVVAIGGITLATAPSVLEAGATAVAVISDLLVTGDPSARVGQYLAELGDPY
ncbi:MAG TPA: thiamine phosphate synthase [Acidobacteria bacterium]|nr:thiamine phosphate synthase [Acidobacteriota bacterium]